MYILIDTHSGHERYVVGDDPHTYSTAADAIEDRDLCRYETGNPGIEIYAIAPTDTDVQSLMFLDGGGLCCPYCGDNTAQVLEWNRWPGRVEGHCRCNICHREWQAKYTLTGLEPDLRSSKAKGNLAFFTHFFVSPTEEKSILSGATTIPRERLTNKTYERWSRCDPEAAQLWANDWYVEFERAGRGGLIAANVFLSEPKNPKSLIPNSDLVGRQFRHTQMASKPVCLVLGLTNERGLFVHYKIVSGDDEEHGLRSEYTAFVRNHLI